MSTTTSPESRRLRSKLANAHRNNPTADVTTIQRDYAAARLEDYIRRTVDEAPPLTREQRDRLAAILRAGDSG